MKALVLRNQGTAVKINITHILSIQPWREIYLHHFRVFMCVCV